MRSGLRCATLLAAGLLVASSCSSDAGSSRPSGPSVTFAVERSAPGSAAPDKSPPTSATDASATAAGTASPASTPATTPATTRSPPQTPETTTPVTTTASSGPGSAALDPATIKVSPFATVTKPLGIAVRTGDQRLFVVTQPGLVVPVGLDGAVGEPVLDMTSLTESGGERGLLGLAFHPTDPLAYVDYTDNDGTTQIDEYGVATDGTFDSASRRNVLSIAQPHANHNGGQLAFGPDGMLYIGMGDGGSANDPDRRALNASDLLGKILRIDPRAAAGQPYTSPADNPFVGVAGARPEVWTVGLRNPWRFSFDPSSGDMWIADVGQGEWEEIDVAWADQGAGRGVNFGWSAFEGSHRFNDDQPEIGVTGPIFEYEHGDAGCSVSGGARYRGSAIAALAGWYVYGDYCSGEVRALQIDGRAAGTQVVLGTPGSVAAVVAGPDGELYVTSVDGNSISKINPA